MKRLVNKIKNKKMQNKIIRVAGVTFNNDDGTSRQKILAKCLANGKNKAKFVKYNFDGEKAIRIITEYGCIGNIPREEIQNILAKVDLMEDITLDIKTFKDDTGKKTFYSNIIIKYANSKKEIKLKKLQDKSKVFTNNIIMKCNNKDCDTIIDSFIKNKILNKNDLYNGLSNKEIMSNYSKVYECNDYVFPCNIIYNEEKKLYEVYYNEYNYNICLGYINKKCNKIVNDIINNKKIINGGIQLLGGKYIEYDYIDKMNKGFDDYSIFIKIRYE